MVFKRLSLFVYTSLITLFLLTLFNGVKSQGGQVGSASVMGHLDRIKEVDREFLELLSILRDFSENRLLYFKKGLGWQNGEFYGFFSGPYSVYFSDRYVGISKTGEAGNEERKLSLDFSKETHYAVYGHSSGYTVTVGMKANSIHYALWTFADGVKVEAGPDWIKVSYPLQDHYYMFHEVRGVPSLYISPQLSSALFSGLSPALSVEVISRDLARDFPYFYFTRILNDGVDNKVNLQDPGETSVYGVNWFREKLGLDPLKNSGTLQRAALNHGRYLIDNGIIKTMQQWDYTSVNLDDYLVLHDEQKSKKGYTGSTPQQRTEKAGYKGPATETATLTNSNVFSEIISWYHSIFHRRPFLSDQVVDYGHAHVKGKGENETVGVANWGMDTSRKSENFVIYPFKDELFVPYAWSAVEAPDPFPGSNEPTGPPITAAFTSPLYLDGTLELFDKQGTKIKCLTSEIIPSPGRYIEITPARPLQPGTAYRIVFTYKNGSYEHSFTTAPNNPAKIEIEAELKILSSPFRLSRTDFDINNAMKLSKKKGQLEIIKIEGRDFVSDKKYQFAFAIPEGWSVDNRRSWQEILLKKESSSIHLLLYAAGKDKDYEIISEKLGNSMKYPEVSKTFVKNDLLSGYAFEYSWKYAGKVLCYYLLFKDYALGIYGYGVTKEEMESILSSFKSHY